MYRSSKSLNIKLRLGEINRRFAELKAVSSKLAGMAAQLDRLREVNEKLGRPTDRGSAFKPLPRRRSSCDKAPREQPTQLARKYEAPGAWSGDLTVHSYRTIRRMRSGTSFARLRRHD